jgi:diguanylate cyclase (GGDEF)-like protein
MTGRTRAPGRRQKLFSALMNARPSHLLDPELFDFKALARKGLNSTKSMPQRDLAPANRQAMLDMMRRISAMDGYETACFVLEIDDWDKIEHQLGCEAGQDIRDTCRRRLRSALCGDDLVADLGAGGFGVVLHPVDTARLTTRDAVADRLRIGLSAPFVQGETRFRLSACIGHAALPGAQEMAAERALAAATKALRDAQVAGPGSVRSYVEARRWRAGNIPNLAFLLLSGFSGRSRLRGAWMPSPRR